MQTTRTSPISIVGNLGITAERKPANIFILSVKPSVLTGETWHSLSGGSKGGPGGPVPPLFFTKAKFSSKN